MPFQINVDSAARNAIASALRAQGDLELALIIAMWGSAMRDVADEYAARRDSYDRGGKAAQGVRNIAKVRLEISDDLAKALAQLPYEIVTLTRSELEQRLYRHADKVADGIGEERGGFRAKFEFWLDILLAEFDTLGRIRVGGVEYRL
jgi:hypothetical protein